MDQFGTFLPINTGDLWPPETIIVPVVGIILVLLIGKFGPKVVKLFRPSTEIANTSGVEPF
jgi:hypothetical protein